MKEKIDKYSFMVALFEFPSEKIRIFIMAIKGLRCIIDYNPVYEQH